MSNEINKQTRSASQPETRENSPEQGIGKRNISHTATFIFTACYVSGGATIALGSIVLAFGLAHSNLALLFVIAGIVILGVGIMFHYFVAQRAEQSETNSPIPPINISISRRDSTNIKQEVVITPSPPPLTTTPFTERIFVDVEPEYLINFFKEHTDAMAKRLLGAYTGKWLRISGKVDNVHSHDNFIQVLVAMPSDSIKVKRASISASFDEQIQRDRVEFLRHNDPISLIGQIDHVFAQSLMLNACEIVE